MEIIYGSKVGQNIDFFRFVFVKTFFCFLILSKVVVSFIHHLINTNREVIMKE